LTTLGTSEQPRPWPAHPGCNSDAPHALGGAAIALSALCGAYGPADLPIWQGANRGDTAVVD